MEMGPLLFLATAAGEGVGSVRFGKELLLHQRSWSRCNFSLSIWKMLLFAVENEVLAQDNGFQLYQRTVDLKI